MNQKQFMVAEVKANAASYLDGEKCHFDPELKAESAQCVEQMHDLAMKLAGDRVGEIYCADDEECEVH